MQQKIKKNKNKNCTKIKQAAWSKLAAGTRFLQRVVTHNKVYLVNTGQNQSFLSSPNTSIKFAFRPKLKPSLSWPVWNIGARNASEMKK